jgi:iron complex outermembrane receptor protein
LEGLKFTAGYRYTWDYRSDYNFQYTVTNGVCTQRAGFHFPNCSVVEDGAFHAGTYTIGLDYQLDPNTLFYVTSRRGYKSGGFNVNFPGNNFAPEYVEDVELGVKSDWNFMGVKGRTDVAAYHSDYTNIQTSAAIFNNGQAGNIIVNGAAATIDGIEVEGTVIPVESVELAATYAYTHAKYDRVAANVTTVQIGTPFLNTPLNKGSLTARYHLPIGKELGDLSVSSTFSYQTHSVVSSGIGAYDGQGSYSLLDFRADWNGIAGLPVDLSFFVTNATDTVYKVGVLDLFTSLGYDDALYNEPRMFGAQLKYHFGGPAPEPEVAPAAYVPPPVTVPAAAPKSYLVFFDFDKSDLTPQAVTIVDQAAHNAGPAKVTRLEVTGHTDTVGSDAYNMRLSRRRAESVAAELEKDGIPSSAIAIIAKGKRDLLVPTADGVKEPQNRRVQIVYDGGLIN